MVDLHYQTRLKVLNAAHPVISPIEGAQVPVSAQEALLVLHILHIFEALRDVQRAHHHGEHEDEERDGYGVLVVEFAQKEDLDQHVDAAEGGKDHEARFKVVFAD